MFRIIHLKGDMFCIIHRKMYSWWGYLEGICSALYILRGGGGGGGGYILHYTRYIYLKGDFSGQPIFHFIYLINLIGQK